MDHRILIIDNHDSFTFNLYHMLKGLAASVDVVRNDEVEAGAIAAADFTAIVVSPGPGNANNADDLGVSAAVLRSDARPILGVCLGHQALAALDGGHVGHAPTPVHGRISAVHHDGLGLFHGLPNPLRAVRYHSWVVRTFPPWLLVNAWTDDGLIMGLKHRALPRWGVQFHPESICTEAGLALLGNFTDLAAGREPGRARLRAPSVRQAAPPGPRADAPPRLRVLAEPLRMPPTLAADPERLFAGLYGYAKGGFWLDSSRVAAGLSRFSFMGTCDEGGGYELSYTLRGDRMSVRRPGSGWRSAAGDPFTHVRERTGRPLSGGEDLPFAFRGGFVGCMGYELKALCGAEPGWHAETPDASLLFIDRFIALDHAEGASPAAWAVAVVEEDAGDAAAADARAWMAALPGRLAAAAMMDAAESPPPTGGVVDVAMRHGRSAYLRRVERCRELITEGESYELCLTNSLRIDRRPDPRRLYRALRARNPAPYAAFVRFSTHTVHSSSPERFLKMDADGAVEAKPIKGTIRRGADGDEDKRLKVVLASSEKDFAENLMIVDLLRHDLGRCCEVGSVNVPALGAIESYATVHQMVSTIRGQRRADVHPMDLIRAAFPAGSMTGAPKQRTLRLLDELEGGARGVYSGALGWIGLDGAADLAVVIRTLVETERGLTLGCGGAVTILSDPVAEYEEMLLKARAPLAAVAAALTGNPEAIAIDEQEPSPHGVAAQRVAAI